MGVEGHAMDITERSFVAAAMIELLIAAIVWVNLI